MVLLLLASPQSTGSDPVYVSSSGTFVNGASANTHTIVIPAPASIVAGNVLVAIIYEGHPNAVGETITAPDASWTSRGSQAAESTVGFMQVWTKVATSSETSSYTFTQQWNSGTLDTVSLAGAIHQYSGADPVPAAIGFTVDPTNSTTQSVGSVTATANNVQIAAWGSWGGRVASSITGFTIRQTPNSATNTALTTADQYLTAAGATGSETITIATADSGIGLNMVLAAPTVALPYTETFPGTAGAAWPAVWTTTSASGSGSATQTGSGTAQLVTGTTSGNSERAIATGLATGTDLDLTGSFTFAVQQANWLNIVIDADNATHTGDTSYTQNGYSLYIGITATPSTGQVWIDKIVGNGNPTPLTSRVTTTWTAGTAYFFRFQRLGTTLQYKLWTGGAEAEPGSWNASVTDGAAAPPAGWAGAVFQSSVTGAQTISLGALTVSNPSSAPAFTAAVNLSGTGALDASSSTLSVATTAVFSATGGLSPVGSPAPAAAVVLSGTGSLTAVPSVKVSSAVVLSATGGLAAAGSPATTAPVGLSGSGNLAVAPVPNPRATVTLSSTGTLTAIPTVATGSPVTLGATGSLAVTGTPTVAGAVTLSGTGALTGAGTPTATGAAVFSGSGSLTVTATTIAASTSVTLTATGSLAASGSAATSQAVDLSATGGLVMAGSASPTVSVAFAASGSLLTTASPSVAASVSLSAVGALLVESGSNGSGTAVFSAVGALVPTSFVQSSSAVLLTGSGLLVAAASQGSTTAVTLSGGGALDSGSSADFTSTVGFAAVGQILTVAGPSATGSGSFSAVGVLSCIAAMRLATTTFFAITNVRSNGLVVEYERTAVQFGILDIQGESFALAGSRVRSMATATRSNPFSVRT